MFWFRVRDEKLFKVGQYPSHVELAMGDLTKYRKLLGEDAREFVRAIGLAAHGVGIGSFVYLRRIIENLVEATHLLAAKDQNWNEEAYGSARAVDKMKILGHRLPEFLTTNKFIYGILSKGIHELNENECLEAFPVLKDAIEMILDEKLAAVERDKKKKDAQEKLEKLQEKHKQ